MNPFEQNGQQLVWRNRGETLTLTPWGQDSLRVCAALMREPEDTRWALMDPQPAGDVEIVLGQERASIRCGRLTAVVELDGWQKHARLRFLNQRGETLLSETAVANALALSSRRYEPHLGGDYAIVQTFEGQPGERIWGMGQYQEERVDWKGCTLELAHRNSQASVPFAVSSLGYGFLWHNPAIGEVTFGENRTTWRADSSRQLDYWITCGDTPREISLHYAAATGFAPLMPEYGLGFWQCKLRYWNQEQLLSVAREYKRRGLPIDVIVCDFFHWPRMGDYRFDPEFFPDPQGMARELREMGIELMVSVWPQVALTSENYPEMLQQGLLVRAEYGEQIGMRFVEDSMFFDATNPRARRYVWDKCKQNYFDKGVRLFWLDEAEPEYGTYDFKAYRYFLGSNQQVGNVYPQRYARGFYEGLSASGVERPLCLLRCAWAGSQRYGALVWSGDVMSTWEDFRKQVCAGLSMGFAGIPWWTTDIGGFFVNIKDPKHKELLLRWFEWATFGPVLRMHGDKGPSEIPLLDDRDWGGGFCHTGLANELWSYGDDVYEVLKGYVELRERMKPYLKEVMREASENGSPVMRPLFYEFPSDEACWSCEDAYMFGPKYLVAPVLYEGMTRRTVYLPKGKWRDMNTGETYEGGCTITVAAPVEIIPVFERL